MRGNVMIILVTRIRSRLATQTKKSHTQYVPQKNSTYGNEHGANESVNEDRRKQRAVKQRDREIAVALERFTAPRFGAPRQDSDHEASKDHPSSLWSVIRMPR